MFPFLDKGTKDLIFETLKEQQRERFAATMAAGGLDELPSRLSGLLVGLAITNAEMPDWATEEMWETAELVGALAVEKSALWLKSIDAEINQSKNGAR